MNEFIGFMVVFGVCMCLVALAIDSHGPSGPKWW